MRLKTLDNTPRARWNLSLGPPAKLVAPWLPNSSLVTPLGAGVQAVNHWHARDFVKRGGF
jgi:cell division inhibitor SulA